MKVRRALVSVHDKAGVVDFARGWPALGVEILSTGGTAKLLRDSGMQGAGRVRGDRLSRDARRAGEDAAPEDPRRHPGRHNVPGHLEALAQHGIPPIDLVVVASCIRSKRRWRAPA